MTVQNINLSYNWTPHEPQVAKREQNCPLQNPLMDLLQAVRATGSIAGAARTLQFSYRYVWGELKRWEQALEQPLILWERGQAARLTEFADKLLWAERQAQARLAPQISALQAELEKTFAVAFDSDSHLLTVYASHDDALVKLREHSASKSLHLEMRFCGSVDAIRALNEGRCTVAGFHAPLQPSANTLTARTYKPLLKTGQHKLIGFATREQGWMVAPGNPKKITGWHDLTRPELRLVNRTLGTGTRLLLDQWLQTYEPKYLPTGYECEEPSHSAVATRIASGQADMGLGIASAAYAQKISFVSLTQEHYWLVCLKSALNNPAVIAFRQVLQSPEWQFLLSQQTGYCLHEEAGQIQSLKKCLPWWAD